MAETKDLETMPSGLADKPKKTYATKAIIKQWEVEFKKMVPPTPPEEIEVRHKAELLEELRNVINMLYKKGFSAKQIAELINERQPIKIHPANIEKIIGGITLKKNEKPATRRRREKIDSVTGEGCEIQPEPANVTEPQLQEQEAAEKHDNSTALADETEDEENKKDIEKENKLTPRRSGSFTMVPDQEL